MELFDRVEVKHQPLHIRKRKVNLGVEHRKRIKTDLKATCAAMYKQCIHKDEPPPKTIHTKSIGRLKEPSCFFGNVMVKWMADRGWAIDKENAEMLCETMFHYKIIVPVYPFIKRFIRTPILYKFARDEEETCMRKENSFKTAKELCVMREQQLRRKQSGGSLHSSGNRSPRRISIIADTAIAGNLLLSLIDKGAEGEVICQQMLRYGYISPVNLAKDSITNISEKQKFFSQEKYRFGEEVLKAVKNNPPIPRLSNPSSDPLSLLNKYSPSDLVSGHTIHERKGHLSRRSSSYSPKTYFNIVRKEQDPLQLPCFFAQTIPKPDVKSPSSSRSSDTLRKLSPRRYTCTSSGNSRFFLPTPKMSTSNER